MKTNFEYDARVYDVYDGDTFKAEVDLGFGVKINQTFRLFGCDTPEMRGEEREQGIIVRDYVRSLILDEQIIIKTHKDKTGKYGRYLAEVTCTNESGGQIHLANHLMGLDMATELTYK